MKEIVNVETSCLILPELNSVLKFKDDHTFFYFLKSNTNTWSIQRNSQYYFIQKLNAKPNGFNEKYFRDTVDFEYFSKKYVRYNYKICCSETSQTIGLSFNLNDFYQRNEDNMMSHHKEIFVNCYCFKLMELDEALKEKYSDVNTGDVIYIISNKIVSNPVNLFKLLNQEIFPFKKFTNAREDNQSPN